MSQQSDDVTIALLELERASPNIRLSWAFPAPGELNANVLGARAQLTADVSSRGAQHSASMQTATHARLMVAIMISS